LRDAIPQAVALKAGVGESHQDDAHVFVATCRETVEGTAPVAVFPQLVSDGYYTSPPSLRLVFALLVRVIPE
jgi:hypothetical protein